MTARRRSDEMCTQPRPKTSKSGPLPDLRPWAARVLEAGLRRTFGRRRRQWPSAAIELSLRYGTGPRPPGRICYRYVTDSIRCSAGPSPGRCRHPPGRDGLPQEYLISDTRLEQRAAMGRGPVARLLRHRNEAHSPNAIEERVRSGPRAARRWGRRPTEPTTTRRFSKLFIASKTSIRTSGKASAGGESCSRRTISGGKPPTRGPAGSDSRASASSSGKNCNAWPRPSLSRPQYSSPGHYRRSSLRVARA